MSQRSRTTKSAPRRRGRRGRKKSKLLAAIVIEAVSAVALFNAYRFAQDVRQSNQPIANSPKIAATAEVNTIPAGQPVFRVPDFAAFTFGDS